jgi:hypothetical protein
VEAANRTACVAAPTVKAASADESTAVAIAAPTVAPAPATVAPTASPAIPWAGTDKHSACEPIRPVIAVRRASVRIVPVVAVGAYRCCSDVAWTDSHAHRDLRLRVCQRQHQNRDQSQIFHVPHLIPLVSDPPLQPQRSSDLPGLPDFTSIRSAYLFELRTGKKVAVPAVADFGHPA